MVPPHPQPETETLAQTHPRVSQSASLRSVFQQCCQVDLSLLTLSGCVSGDINAIVIGDKTNIQDNVVVHVAKHSLTSKTAPTIIGNAVTVGHGATLHACTIGDGCLVSHIVLGTSRAAATSSPISSSCGL